MPQVKLKIEVNGGTTASGFNVSADKSANNVGFSSMPQSFDDSFKGTKLLVIDSLYINDKGFLANGVDEDAGQLQSEQNKRQFVYGKTNSNGEYELTLTMTTDTGTFDRIVIIGDSVGNQFPIEAIVDGTTTIYSDDYIWALDLGDKQSSHTIKFTKWNKANYNACFNQVKIMLQYYEIDRFNGLKQVESLSQSTPDASSIYYGTLANSGSAEIVDVDGEIEDMINDGILDNSNVPVELYIDNHLVQSHITTDSDYTPDKILNLQFTNKIEYWDKITYNGYAYTEEQKTAYEMLYDVLDSLGYEQSVDDMLSEQIIFGNDNSVGTIKSYLQLITIPYPYLPSDTYRNTIDKFCRLAQLQVYQKDNGDIKFISARPVVSQSQKESAIVVPKYAQVKNLNKTIILKNKYNAVEIGETQINDVIDYDTNCYSYKKSSNIQTFDTSNYANNRAYAYNNQFIWNLYSCILLKYKDFTIKIPKKSTNRLDSIEKLYSGLNSMGDPYIRYSVTYKKKNGVASTNKTNYQTLISPDNTTRVYSGDYSPSETGQLSNSYTYSDSSFVSGVSSTSTATDNSTNSTATYTEDDENYYITLRLLVSKEEFGTKTLRNSNSGQETNYDGTATTYDMFEINISFNGDKRTISFEDVSASDTIVSKENIFSDTITSWDELGSDVDIVRYAFYPDDISSYNVGDKIYFKDKEYIIDEIDTDSDYFAFPFSIYSNLYQAVSNQSTQNIVFSSGIIPTAVATIQGSELLQTGTLYNNLINMTTLIKDNIKSDYANGLSNGDIELFCLDYKDANNDKVINFNNGEILENNNVLSIEGDNKTWQVTGRQFKYYGQSTTNIEVKEVKPVTTWEDVFTYQKQYDSTYKITGMTDLLSENVVVPNYHNGKVINRIGGINNFNRKTEIETVKLSDSITSIDASAFDGCTSLTSINIPNSVTTIDFYAFQDCTSLTSVTIPSSVTYMAEGIFKNCSGLSEVYIYADTNNASSSIDPSYIRSFFYGCSSSLVIHIPSTVTDPSTTYGQYWNYYSQNGQLSYVADL